MRGAGGEDSDQGPLDEQALYVLLHDAISRATPEAKIVAPPGSSALSRSQWPDSHRPDGPRQGYSVPFCSFSAMRPRTGRPITT